MENIAVQSKGFKELKCSCGYFRSDGKRKLYRMPNQFGICEVHEPLAMFFNKKRETQLVGYEAIRQAVANYMGSEGCSCCQDIDKHKEHKARLGELLNVPKYSDGSGYDFLKFRSKE